MYSNPATMHRFRIVQALRVKWGTDKRRDANALDLPITKLSRAHKTYVLPRTVGPRRVYFQRHQRCCSPGLHVVETIMSWAACSHCSMPSPKKSGSTIKPWLWLLRSLSASTNLHTALLTSTLSSVPHLSILPQQHPQVVENETAACSV